MYRLCREQFLPISIKAAWSFFSSPGNLARITPPSLDFKILGDALNGEIYDGMLIDYSVKPMFGIPWHWRTEILDVKKYFHFVDRRIKGPYKIWEHTHYFVEKEGGVLMRDEVKYELPLGFIGKLIHHFIVRKKLNEIFEFRKNTLSKLFKNDSN